MKQLILILVSLIILVGCNTENSNTKLESEKNKEMSANTTETDDTKDSENLEEKTNKTEKENINNLNNENEVLNEDLDKDKSSNQAKDSYQKKFILYFIKDDENNYLFETEEVEITVYNNQTANAVLKELLKPQNAKRNKIPNGTTLNSINLENGILYVDLSEEFKNNINLGSGYETMMIYTIVNSVTELDNVDKVQFKIEGEIINYLSHVSLDKPFSQNIEPIGN